MFIVSLFLLRECKLLKHSNHVYIRMYSQYLNSAWHIEGAQYKNEWMTESSLLPWAATQMSSSFPVLNYTNKSVLQMSSVAAINALHQIYPTHCFPGIVLGL